MVANLTGMVGHPPSGAAVNVAGLHPNTQQVISRGARAFPNFPPQPYFQAPPYQTLYNTELSGPMYQTQLFQAESVPYPVMESYSMEEVPPAQIVPHRATPIATDSIQNAVAYQNEVLNIPN